MMMAGLFYVFSTALSTPPIYRAMRLPQLHVPRHTPVHAIVIDGGEIGGPFWDEFGEDASAEAEVLGLTIKSMKFQNGKLAVLASGAGVGTFQHVRAKMSATALLILHVASCVHACNIGGR